MTTPTLALGISAAGAQTVADLAAAVGSLKNNLKELAQTTNGGTIGNLESLAAEFRTMRQELGATLQGLRTDLVSGFAKAFDSAAVQAKAGGDKVASEVAKARVKVSAEAVKLGQGLKASVSGSGLDSVEAVKELHATAQQYSGAQEFAAKEIANSSLAFRLKLAAEAKKTSEAQMRNAIEEANGSLAYRLRLAVEQAATDAAREKAAADNAFSALASNLKAFGVAEEVSEAKRKAAIEEANGTLAYRLKMAVEQQKVDEARQQASAANAFSSLTSRLRTVGEAEDTAKAHLEASKLEANGTLAYRLKIAVEQQKLDEARAAVTAANAFSSLTSRLQAIAAAEDTAKAQLEASKLEANGTLAYRLKIAVEQQKLDEARATVTAANAFSSLASRLQTIAAAEEEGRAKEEAALLETNASLGYRLALTTAAQKTERAEAEAAAKELAAAEKRAAAIQLAQQTVNAAYAAASERSQLTSVIGARAQLNEGIAPSTVAGRFGDQAAQLAAAAPSLQALRAELDNVSRSAPKAKAEMATFTAALQDGHSAARGLASGFGAMWLTWGAMLPLLAGAGLSHGFMQTIKLGADVEQSMTTIRVLSEETTQAVSDLNTEMMEMGRTGPFGPREIATAMKTLSLAGLDAASVYGSIKDVLRFAVAGDTTIQKSADVMTTIGTAFKISAQDYNYIGDVIAKTAAVSKASVENIAESFKSASVINSQYGASLKDVGLGIAVLNNVGVTGSATGTSLRNFYVDILGRTPKVQKALQAIGLDAEFAFDKATGKARGFVAIITDLSNALKDKDSIGVTKALEAIFSQRGGKGPVEALALITSKMKTSKGEFANDLKYLEAQIQESAGFMSLSFAEMSLTSANQVKGTVSALQTSLVAAFDRLQPYVVSMAQQLKLAFNSPEFQDTITNLMRLMGAITLSIVENADKWIMLGGVLIGLKVFGVVSSLIEVTTGKLIAGTAALMGNAFAAEVAGGANSALAATYEKRAAADAVASTAAAAGAASTRTLATTLGTVLSVGTKVLGWAGLAITAWQLYSFWTDKSDASAKNKVDHSGALLDALKAEADRLHDINTAYTLKISLEELDRRKRAEAAQRSTNADAEAAGAPKIKEAERLEALAGPKPISQEAVLLRNRRLEQAKALREQARVDKEAAISDAYLSNQALGAEQARIRTEADIQAKRVEAAAKERQARPPGGSPFVLPNSKQNGSDTRSNPLRDNEMSALSTMLQQRETVLRKAYEDEQAILDAKHKGDLISEGAYQSEVLRSTVQFEGDERNLILSSLEKLAAARDKRKAYLEDTLSDDPERKKQELENLANEYNKMSQTAQNALDAINSGAFKRQTLAVISMDTETKKLTKTNDEYWLKAVAGQDKEDELAQARANNINLSENERAAIEAQIKVSEAHSVHLQELSRDYKLAQTALAEFQAQNVLGQWDEDAQRRFKGLSDQVQALAAAIDKSKTNVAGLQDRAAKSAISELTTKRAIEFSNSMSSMIADSILSGGKDGGKKLKDWLKSYFIREPLTIFLRGEIQSIAGQYGSMLFGGPNGGFNYNALLNGGGAGSVAQPGGAGIGSLLNNASSLNTVYGAGMQYLTGSSAGASGVSLGYANAVGLTGGDSIGALAAANGGWAGVGSAVGAAGGSTLGVGAGLGGSMMAGAAGYTGVAGTAATGALGSGTAFLGTTGATGFTGALGTGTALLGTEATGLTAVGSTAAVGATTAGVGAGAAAGLAAIPVVGWIALAAIAAYAIWGGKGGGPKVESGYGFGIDRTPNPDASKLVVDSITDKYKTIAGDFAKDLNLGVFSAKDPKGSAQTQLQVIAGFNGQSFYNRGNRLGTTENVGRDDKDLEAALAEETTRVIMGALQATNMPTELGKWLHDLGDLSKLTTDQLDADMKRVEKALTERATLEDQLFALTGSALEVANREREKERKQIDETNLVLYDHITVLKDLIAARDAANVAAEIPATPEPKHTKTDLMDAYQREQDAASKTAEALTTAHDALTSAYDKESSALQEAIDKHRNYAASLREAVRALDLGDLSPHTSPVRTSVAKATFDVAASRAQTGDTNALDNLAQYGQDYLTALKKSASSALEYRVAFGRVQSTLRGTSVSQDASADVAQLQLDAMKQQLTTLGVLAANSDKTVAQLVTNYEQAKVTNQVAVDGLASETYQMQLLGLINQTQLSWIQAFVNYTGAVHDAQLAQSAIDANIVAYNAQQLITQQQILAATVAEPAAAATATDPSVSADAVAIFGARAHHDYAPGRIGTTIGNDRVWLDPDPNDTYDTNLYASGGVFTNGIVSQPTMFNESVMGEAGPEAIMPLVRTGSGLAVRAVSNDTNDELVRALIEQVTLLRSESQATAKQTYLMQKYLLELRDRGIFVRNNPSGEVLQTTVV